MPPKGRPRRERARECPQRYRSRSPPDRQQVQEEVIEQAPPAPDQLATIHTTMVAMMTAQNKRIEDFMNSFQPPNLPAQQAHIPAALGAAPAPPAQMPEQQTNGTGEDVPLQQVIAQGAVPGLRLAIPDQQLGENPMSSYLTLGCSVEGRIKTKIWQGLYIELTSLASLGGPQASVSLNWSGEHPSICMAPPQVSTHHIILGVADIVQDVRLHIPGGPHSRRPSLVHLH